VFDQVEADGTMRKLMDVSRLADMDGARRDLSEDGLRETYELVLAKERLRS